jgi:hypothetical protein
MAEKGMASKMIIINGSIIVALLVVLIIVISVRKFVMFKYWKRNMTLDHALPNDTVYVEADEVPSHKNRKKEYKKRESGGKSKTTKNVHKLALMCYKSQQVDVSNKGLDES